MEMQERFNMKYIVAIIIALSASVAYGQDKSGVKFFNDNILPVLQTQCYSCHSSASEKTKGGFAIDTRQGILNGGDSGISVVPGKPEESSLFDYVESGDMPPDNPLDKKTVDLFRQWIKMGLPDPRYKHENRAIELRQARQFWSFKKVKRPAVLPYENGTEIDGLIDLEMQKQGLKPVELADDYTIMRRLYYDIIGLPPSEVQIRQFIQDKSENRYEKLVDTLLDDEGYGEKWGRHWLDIARYGESSGQDRNLVNPYAWRYRDYVIDSFNQDKPFNEFITEQIAGDLLSHKTYEDYNNNRIATGFLTVGTKNIQAQTKQFEADRNDDQIDAVTRGFLGMTLSCARCHDHKFDPFSQEDYYGVAGLFSNTQNLDGLSRGNNNTGYLGNYDFLVSKETEELYKKKQINKWLALCEIKNLESQLESIKIWNKRATPEQIKRETDKRQKKINELKTKLNEKDLAYLEFLDPIMAVRDKTKMTEIKIAIRGEVNNLGDEVPRRLPEIFSDRPLLNFDNTSGRYQLAEWVAHKTNPLTYRVHVNRVWRHLFGKGILDSFDNFGILGGEPTNLKLMNYLSGKFVTGKLSNKRLIKTIVMSNAYRRSSNFNKENFEIDPDNVYVWRMNEKRLEAEQIRDALLFVSGKLEGSHKNVSDMQTNIKAPGKELKKYIGEAKSRSIYIPSLRDNKIEILDVFDRPDNSLLAAERNVTTVSTQALFLMNNPKIIAMCKEMAAEMWGRNMRMGRTMPRLLYHNNIHSIWKKTLGRHPSEEEFDKAMAFYLKGTEQAEQIGLGVGKTPEGEEFVDYTSKVDIKKKNEIMEKNLASLIQILICTGEFRNVK
jgi:hypothetical protein